MINTMKDFVVFLDLKAFNSDNFCSRIFTEKHMKIISFQNLIQTLFYKSLKGTVVNQALSVVTFAWMRHLKLRL